LNAFEVGCGLTRLYSVGSGDPTAIIYFAGTCLYLAALLDPYLVADTLNINQGVLKMRTYAFAMPLLPGKTETWLKYVNEITGPRKEDWKKSRQRLGLQSEQVWLQNTPMGDMCVVKLETDDPGKFFENLMKSNEPFDLWFKEKVLIECHGLKEGQAMPPLNKQVMYLQVSETEYAKDTTSKVSAR
jgi:hypothetical protein